MQADAAYRNNGEYTQSYLSVWIHSDWQNKRTWTKKRKDKHP